MLCGRTFYRIRALVNIGEAVKAGDLGGWVESERNLSQYELAWVGGDAKVGGNVIVTEAAYVGENAYIDGNVLVSGNAVVNGNAHVVGGSVWVCGNAAVNGNAHVSGNVKINGNAYVGRNAKVDGNAYVSENAWVCENYDHITIGPIGSRNGYTSFNRAKDGTTLVVCGCFHGTIEEFETAVRETHGDNQHEKAYMAAIQFVRSVINTEAVSDDRQGTVSVVRGGNVVAT